MKYIKTEEHELSQALGLTDEQIFKIEEAINNAYLTDFNTVDDINLVVAPFLDTPEEAFYASSIILTDVFEAESEVEDDA